MDTAEILVLNLVYFIELSQNIPWFYLLPLVWEVQRIWMKSYETWAWSQITQEQNPLQKLVMVRYFWIINTYVKNLNYAQVMAQTGKLPIH